MPPRTSAASPIVALLLAACASSEPGAPASDSSTDVPVDVTDADADAPACCPRDPMPSSCMQMGGTPIPSLGCVQTCDFWCSTNWRVETDENGCEEWRYDHDPACDDAGADG